MMPILYACAQRGQLKSSCWPGDCWGSTPYYRMAALDVLPLTGRSRRRQNPCRLYGVPRMEHGYGVHSALRALLASRIGSPKRACWTPYFSVADSWICCTAPSRGEATPIASGVSGHLDTSAQVWLPQTPISSASPQQWLSWAREKLARRVCFKATRPNDRSADSLYRQGRRYDRA